MAVFRCNDCGNLHGAPVHACGMCGSGAVIPWDEDKPASPLQAATALVDRVMRSQFVSDQRLHAALELLKLEAPASLDHQTLADASRRARALVELCTDPIDDEKHD